MTQVTKSRYAVASSANKGDTPSDSGQEKLEKQRELVESMFPGENVHHNAICSNCSKDCGNFKHEWLHKKELAFCPETKIWWLAFVEGKGMFCLLCRKHDCQNPQNKSAVFNKTPATRCRPATLKEHVGTPLSSHSHPGKRKQQHQDAIYREMLQRTSFFQKQLDEERLYGDEGLVKAFTAFYFVAKEEMANSKVLPLLKLLEVLGAREIGTFGHRSKGSLHEIFCTIGEAVLDQIIDQISDSGCVGLLCDDVTDIATLEQMLTFVQYVHSGKVSVRFLTIDNLLAESTSANAATMLAVLEQRFQQLGIEMSKIVSLASDGASVMMGKTGGLAAKLRDKHCPTLLNIHCVCHRLALACTHSVADIAQVGRVETNLRQLWKYFDNSPKRLSVYTKVQEKQKQVHLSTDGRKKVTKRLQKACKTRWLSFDKAVKAAHEDLDSILLCLSELADDATADGLLKKLKSPDWIAALYILTDVLPVLSLLSRTFQKGSINFSQIQPSIEITVASLQAIPEQNKALSRLKSDFGEGGRFHFLSSDISITERVLERASTMQVKYVTKLVENIHNRFDSDAMSVLSAFKIFNPMELPSKESEKWADYGLAEVETLAQHFFPSNKKMFDQVTAEFSLLKYHMQTFMSNAKNASSTEICLSTLLGNSAYAKLMPAIVHIAEVALSMPVSNAWPERGASTVKRIKTRLRGSLENRMLNSLMHISINGPDLHTPEVNHLIKMAVKKWQTTKERRKVKQSLQTAVPKSCDVGCQADIQNWQILQPEVGTSTQEKPLESMELEHPLDSEDTVEDEEVELHTEEEMAEEQNMEDVYHIFNLTECSSDIDSAFGSESEDDF